MKGSGPAKSLDELVEAFEDFPGWGGTTHGIDESGGLGEAFDKWRGAVRGFEKIGNICKRGAQLQA